MAQSGEGLAWPRLRLRLTLTPELGGRLAAIFQSGVWIKHRDQRCLLASPPQACSPTPSLASVRASFSHCWMSS